MGRAGAVKGAGKRTGMLTGIFEPAAGAAPETDAGEVAEGAVPACICHGSQTLPAFVVATTLQAQDACHS
jgi:hypothetical protein